MPRTMKKIKFSAMLAISLVVFISGCGGSGDKALLLKDWDKVYLPLDIQTLRSMDEALKEKGYGNVKTADMKIVFTYRPAKFNDALGPAVVVYSDVYSVPTGMIFTEMRVWQCYEAVLADPAAQGICVNPDAPGKNPYTVSKSEMSRALGKLPRQEKLPLDISIKK